MQKKLSFRLLCCAIVLVLSLGLLAGCGGSAAQSNVPAGSAAGSTADGTAGSGSSGAPTVLRVEVFDRAVQGGTNPTNNYWTKWISDQMMERHNIEVQFVGVPRSEEIQQLNVLMAGGDAPDIVFTYTMSVVYNYYKQGGVADLTDLIEQYGSTIKSYLGEEVLSYGRFDDRQYMIPAKRIARGTYTTYMRKDWLDAVGLPVPTTHDEFYNALAEFKSQNPGKVEQVIPYAAAADIPWHAGPIVDSFLEPNLSEEERFVNNVSAPGQAEAFLYPGFKEGIRYLNKMYNAGLIDPQFPLYKDYSPVDDLISRGLVGSFTANYDYPLRPGSDVYNKLMKNVPGAELVPVDCFPNSAGKNFKQMYLPTGIYNFVPASSKNVEAAVKYFNFLCEDDVRVYLTTGEEGVNHTKDEEGIPVMISLLNDDRMMNSANNLDYAMVVNGVDLGDSDKNIKVLSKSYDAGFESIFEQAYNISLKDAAVNNPTIVPFESEAQFSANLNEKRREILSNAITASEANFDKVYDTGLQEWLSAGGQQCKDERQAWWDANKK